MRAGVRERGPAAARPATEAGAGLPELVAILALVGLFMVSGVPSFMAFYRTHQLRSAAGTIQDLVRDARVRALKEKTPHRVLIRDDTGSPANTIEIQAEQSGSFVTLDGHVYAIADGVAILGAGATDSLDSVTVGKRGDCDVGKVYLRGHEGRLQVIDIASTCFTSAS